MIPRKISNVVLLALLSCWLNSCKNSEQKQSASQTDWPIYRGDRALSGYVDSEAPKQPQLLWSFQTRDEIKASPVISGDRIFIGSGDANMYALQLQTGQQAWFFKADEAIEAPALVVDSLLYFGTLKGTMYCLRASDGTEKWRYEINDRIMGSANWLQAPNRTEKWIVFGGYDNQIHCLNGLTGEKIWAVSTDNYINGAPATDSQRIFFGGCDALLHVVDAFTGKQLGEIDAGSYIPSSPAIDSKHAFVGQYDGEVLSMDIANKTVLWRFSNPDNKEAFFSSPAVTPDEILIGSRDKQLYCIDKKTGQKKWAFRTKKDVDSSPLVCRDRVIFCSSDGRVYMVNLNNGQLIWSYEIGKPITGSPAFSRGIIVIAGEDSRVYAFADKP